MSDDVRSAKDRGWRELSAVDRAYESGELDDDGWHDAVRALIEPAYLAAGNPRGESGHSGDDAQWEHARRLLVDALPGDCDFLDVGCANGYLMASMVGWAAAAGITIEPYGVEISPALADLARTRYPQWRDRIWTANAFRWQPPRRFSLVRTGLDYVPRARRRHYMDHLIDAVVAPGGRLVVGVLNEERDNDALHDEVVEWGFGVTGRTSREHSHPALAYKAFCIDIA